MSEHTCFHVLKSDCFGVAVSTTSSIAGRVVWMIEVSCTHVVKNNNCHVECIWSEWSGWMCMFWYWNVIL